MVKYKESANVQKSLVANGCVVDSGKQHCLEVSWLKGACIKTVIIMQRCDIEKDTWKVVI